MGFFNWIRGKSTSKEIAKSRLKFVLVQDRMNCSPGMMEDMRRDIIKVITSYMEVDEDGLDIELTTIPEGQEDAGSAMLYVNIPVVESKRYK